MRITLPLILLLAFTACGDSKKEVLELKEKVIAVHDVIMPDMDNINILERQISSMKAITTDETQKARLEQALSDLHKADDGMMDWMRDFDNECENKPAEDAKTYLLIQQKAIEKVGEDMKSAQKNAQALLDELTAVGTPVQK